MIFFLFPSCVGSWAEQACVYVCSTCVNALVWAGTHARVCSCLRKPVLDSCRPPPLLPHLIDRGRIAQSNLDTALIQLESCSGEFSLFSVALNSSAGSKALRHSQAGVLGNQSSFWTCQQALQPPSHHPSPQSFIFSCYSRANGKTLEESTHCSQGLWNRFVVMEFFIKKLKS